MDLNHARLPFRHTRVTQSRRIALLVVARKEVR